MGWLVALVAASGVLVWRRKTLKEDAEKAKEAGKGAVAKVTRRGGGSDEEIAADPDSAGEESAADAASIDLDNDEAATADGEKSESDKS